MSSTEVLKATLIPVDERVYRLLPIRDSLKNVEEELPTRKNIYLDDEEEEDLDPDLPITHQGNTFFITFHVPSEMMKHVIGSMSKNVKALESQYNVKIKTPSRKSTDTAITVAGSTRKDIRLTYHSVMTRVNRMRLLSDTTHFISLPMNFANLQESFLKFKKEVLEKYKGVRGVDESIFQNTAKLHCTVAPLVLLDKRDSENAIAILTKCKEDIMKDLGEKEFLVRVKGIEYMNDDPAEVNVLYAKLHQPGGDNSLQILCDKILNEFMDANLAKRQSDRVKLHITLMNTRFRDKLEDVSEGDEKVQKEENAEHGRISFDARPILKDYLDYDFGEVVISEIHISIMYTAAKDGFYKPVCKMNLGT